MRIVGLEIGRIMTQRSVLDGGDGAVLFPVPSWLIEHRDGLVLFDTGMHASLQDSVERIGADTASRFTPDFEAGEEVAARLDERAIRASDITHVVFSHLHFDHAGGTNELPDARIVVQRAEWQAGHDQRLIDHGVYNPADYDLGHDVQQVDGKHDVLLDHVIVLIQTPENMSLIHNSAPPTPRLTS